MKKAVSKQIRTAVSAAAVLCLLLTLCLAPATLAQLPGSSKTAPSSSKGIAVPGKGKKSPKLPNPAILSIALDSRCRIVVKVANRGKGALPESVHKSAKLLLAYGKEKREFALAKVDPGGRLLEPGGTKTLNTGIVLKSAQSVTAKLSWKGALKETDLADNSLAVSALEPKCVQIEKGAPSPLAAPGKGGKSAPAPIAGTPGKKPLRLSVAGPLVEVGKIYLSGDAVHVVLSIKGTGTPSDKVLSGGAMTVKTPAGKGKWSLTAVFRQQEKRGRVSREVDFDTGLVLVETGKVEVKFSDIRSAGERHAILTPAPAARAVPVPPVAALRKTDAEPVLPARPPAMKAFGGKGAGVPGRVVPMMLVEGVYILDPSGGDVIRLSDGAVEVRYRFTASVERGETTFRLMSAGGTVAESSRIDDPPGDGGRPAVYTFSLAFPPGFEGCSGCIMRVSHGTGNFGESDPFSIGDVASFLPPPFVSRGVRVELLGDGTYLPGEELVFRYRRTCMEGPTPPDLGMFYHAPELDSFDEMYRWGIIARESVGTIRDSDGYIRVTWHVPRPEEPAGYVITVTSGEECWGSSRSFLVADPATAVIGSGGGDEPSRGITVRSPNGGELFTKGDLVPVEWDVYGYPEQSEMPDFTLTLNNRGAGWSESTVVPFHDSRLECVRPGPGARHRCSTAWRFPTGLASFEGFTLTVSGGGDSDESDDTFNLTGLWIEGIVEGATYHHTEWRRFRWGGPPGTEPRVNLLIRNSGGGTSSFFGPAHHETLTPPSGHSADFLWLVGGTKTGSGPRDWEPDARSYPPGSGYRIVVSNRSRSEHAVSPPFTIAAPELWIGCFNSLARGNRWGRCEDVPIHDGDTVDISWGGEGVNHDVARVRISVLTAMRNAVHLAERDFADTPFRYRVTRRDIERRWCDEVGCEPLFYDLDIDPLYFRVTLLGWNLEEDTVPLNYVE